MAKTIDQVKEYIIKLAKEAKQQEDNFFISDEVHSCRNETLKEILDFIDSEDTHESNI